MLCINVHSQHHQYNKESKEIILHEPLSDNLSMDLSKSKCSIVHKTLSHNNSSDVPNNVITELKEDKHIEPSVNDKGSSFKTYSSAVEIYWINRMLRINGRSQHHQYNKDYIKYLHHEIDTMI